MPAIIMEVRAVNLNTLSESTLMTEETRYIGSDGMPVNLA
jgi:hypothetical protein